MTPLWRFLAAWAAINVLKASEFEACPTPNMTETPATEERP